LHTDNADETDFHRYYKNQRKSFNSVSSVCNMNNTG